MKKETNEIKKMTKNNRKKRQKIGSFIFEK